MTAFRKGDIILPLEKVARENWLYGLFHPAVVWNDFNDKYDDFAGIMLTHSPPNAKFENVLMTSSHFEIGHQVGFSNTNFVNQIFIKFQNWGPFEIVGKLTNEGIEFLENNLDTSSFPIEFIHYRHIVTV